MVVKSHAHMKESLCVLLLRRGNSLQFTVLYMIIFCCSSWIIDSLGTNVLRLFVLPLLAIFYPTYNLNPIWPKILRVDTTLIGG